MLKRIKKFCKKNEEEIRIFKHVFIVTLLENIASACNSAVSNDCDGYNRGYDDGYTTGYDDGKPPQGFQRMR
jgi:hypothetical protein